ncbi:MAG TPA: MBL fold metallo-hydrolase [Opitutales bacterium]|nr:MBL fold metallo-hydrolase [Opitutales bacterium]
MEPLEDAFPDIVRKAMLGRGIGREALSERLGIRRGELERLLSGQMVEPGLLMQTAEGLRLNPDCLLAVAHDPRIEPPTIPDRVQRLSLPFGEWTVNAWVIIDTSRKHALLFDTGTRALEITSWLSHHDLGLSRILITHNHPDHVGGLPGLLLAVPGAGIAVPSPLGCAAHARLLQDRDRLEWEDLEIGVRSTPGHTADSVSYIVEGLGFPILVSGDALFARSVGGMSGGMDHAVARLKTLLNALPSECLILPGHGPATTVSKELLENPFLAVA